MRQWWLLGQVTMSLTGYGQSVLLRQGAAAREKRAQRRLRRRRDAHCVHFGTGVAHLLQLVKEIGNVGRIHVPA
jgi:hypothetical protein